MTRASGSAHATRCPDSKKFLSTTGGTSRQRVLDPRRPLRAARAAATSTALAAPTASGPSRRETAAMSDLDAWIAKIRKCELLPEVDLKHLCEYVQMLML